MGAYLAHMYVFLVIAGPDRLMIGSRKNPELGQDNWSRIVVISGRENKTTG